MDGHLKSRFLLALGGAVCLALALAASSCGGLGAFCTFDSDCLDGRLCVESACRTPCASDEDCGTFEGTCQPHLRPSESEPINVCLPDDDQDTDQPAGCSTDDECVTLLNDPAAICGFDQTCVIGLPDDTVHSLLLLDKTPLEEGVDGIDIAAALVRDAEGAVVGFGDTVMAAHANGTSLPGHLDGSAPALNDAGQCVEGSFDEAVTSLGGDGGYYLLQFVDTTGQPLRLEEGWAVVVIEWGGNCAQDEEASPDRFDAYLCATRPQREVAPSSDCEHLLGRDAAGFAEFMVTGL